MKKKLATFSISVPILNELETVSEKIGCSKSWLVQYCIKDKLEYLIKNKEKYFLEKETENEGKPMETTKEEEIDKEFEEWLNK